MPTQTFIETRFGEARLERIQQANAIIDDYLDQGYTLTLRQLYYQFVARDLIPNTERSYKALGDLISKARLAGLIDWEAIEDRTRNLVSPPAWDSPAEIVEACARQYRVDLWAGQKIRPEVWIEKEALVGVIEGVCDDLGVAYFACRGYVSQSEQWRAGRRAKARQQKTGQETLILHLGDHDPSGIDMTRDNEDRLGLFAQMEVEVWRLALNRDQIEEYDPPPNPAKVTDSRAAGYIELHGESSWELDALEPRVIGDLILEAVGRVRDDRLMDQRREEQAAARERLEQIAAELAGEGSD